MVNYRESIIYLLFTSLNDDSYIGSTSTRTLDDRLGSHKYRAKNGTSKLHSKMRVLGIDTFQIKEIEKFPCKCKEELRYQEQVWINRLKPTLNVRDAIKLNLVINGLTDDAREYFAEKEREKRLERNKQYQSTHKEERAIAAKEYRAKNADRIHASRKEKLKKKIYGCCNRTYNRQDYTRHLKSRMHQERYPTIVFEDV